MINSDNSARKEWRRYPAGCTTKMFNLGRTWRLPLVHSQVAGLIPHGQNWTSELACRRSLQPCRIVTEALERGQRRQLVISAQMQRKRFRRWLGYSQVLTKGIVTVRVSGLRALICPLRKRCMRCRNHSLIQAQTSAGSLKWQFAELSNKCS